MLYLHTRLQIAVLDEMAGRRAANRRCKQSRRRVPIPWFEPQDVADSRSRRKVLQSVRLLQKKPLEHPTFVTVYRAESEVAQLLAFGVYRLIHMVLAVDDDAPVSLLFALDNLIQRSLLEDGGHGSGYQASLLVFGHRADDDYQCCGLLVARPLDEPLDHVEADVGLDRVGAREEGGRVSHSRCKVWIGLLVTRGFISISSSRFMR